MAERSGEGAPVAPPGWERWIAARLPRTLLVGLLLPWLLVLLRRWAANVEEIADAMGAALGWSVFHVSVCVAIATGCWVVMVMKGPPRQADSYPPAGRSSPLKKGPDRPLP